MIAGIIIVILTGLICFAYWCYEHRRKFKSIECFPGPKPLPFFGNVLEFGMDPVERLRNITRIMRTYGSNVRIYLGPTRAFLLSTDPEFTEFILSSPKHIDKSVEYDLLRPWLMNGLLVSTGSYWQKRRKALTPTFHFKILEEFLPIISENTDILTTKLKSTTGNQPFDIYPYVTAYTLDNICETSMGTSVNAQKQPGNEYVQAVKDMCLMFNERAFSAWKYFDILFRFSLSYIKQCKYADILHGFAKNIIEERREQLSKGTSSANLSDEFGSKKRIAFLDLLLQIEIDGKPLTNNDVIEEVNTFMFEGHDTTASAIAFTLYELSRNPEVQEKLWKEIQELFGGDKDRQLTQTDLSRMKYTEMVLKETLRLYPSVPFFARKLAEDVTYKGVVLPKDLQVLIYIFEMQRRGDLFKEPERYKPERFLPDSGDTKHPFAYVPFSAGPRNCIGQKFAMQEMKIALYKIVSMYKILPAPRSEDVILSGEVILKSANGIHVRLEKR